MNKSIVYTIDGTSALEYSHTVVEYDISRGDIVQSNDIPKLTTEQQHNINDLIIIAIYKKICTDNVIDKFKITELINKHQRGETL